MVGRVSTSLLTVCFPLLKENSLVQSIPLIERTLTLLRERERENSRKKKKRGNLDFEYHHHEIGGIVKHQKVMMDTTNLELQEAGWEELRKEARKIEGDLDVKLSSYAKLCARFTQGGSGYADTGSPTVASGRSWKSMEMEIQSLLEKLLDTNDAMSRCAASTTPTTSVTQKLARHRDILHEFTQEFRRIKGNISSMREHAELLTSVRDDITEYKASGSMTPQMHLLRERAAIHGSITQIDDVISQAQTTRTVLGSQRTLIGDVQGKVKQLSDKFPLIRTLLGAIKRKRSRDTLILAAVISACTLFLIIYWFSK